MDVDELLELDDRTRKLQHELNLAQGRKKSISKEFAKSDDARRQELRAESAELDQQLGQLRDAHAEDSARLNSLLLVTPQIPWEGAPVGPDESANVVVKTWGAPPEFDFETLDHVPWPRSAAGPSSPGPARWPANAPTR